MPDVDIAIIGGGIAGLSAAAACSQIGRDAHVFEAAPAFAPIGTSLSLWPNAMACLHEWGLADQIAHDGAPINSVAWRRYDGRAYFTNDLSDHYAAIGHTGICVRRADLHRHLASAIPNARLNIGKRLQSWTDHGHEIVLRFEDGSTVTANHMIGADGVWSQIRSATLNDGPPTYAGYGAWLGLSSAPAPLTDPYEGTEYMGPNGRMGVFESGHDTRYWFFIANMPDSHQRAGATDVSEVGTLIRDWPQAFHDLLDKAHQNTVTKVGFYDRPVSRKWGAGNVTLIGDAIHPFLPNLGQGACQAIEDAHMIAAAFAAGKTGADVTRWMEAKRFKRVREMQQTSRQVGLLGQTENAFTRATRSAMGKWPLSIIGDRQFKRHFTR